MKYWKFPALLLAVSLSILVSSCGNLDDEIVNNRKKIVNLKKGMTKSEVVKLMGEPIKGEVYCEDNVWYYYTDCKWSDGAYTSDECTPIVFEDGKIAGWGREYYNHNHRFKEWER